MFWEVIKNRNYLNYRIIFLRFLLLRRYVPPKFNLSKEHGKYFPSPYPSFLSLLTLENPNKLNKRTQCPILNLPNITIISVPPSPPPPKSFQHTLPPYPLFPVPTYSS